MAEANVKKRRPNFSDEELHALIAAVQERKTSLLAKFDMNVTAKTKNSEWEAVAREVKLVGRIHRDFAKVEKSSVILYIVYFVYIVTFVYLTSKQKENQCWNMFNMRTCNIGIKQTVHGRHY